MEEHTCGICKKRTVFKNMSDAEDRACVSMTGHEIRTKKGIKYANVSYLLDCGHFMLDDIEEGCPDYIEEGDFK